MPLSGTAATPVPRHTLWPAAERNRRAAAGGGARRTAGRTADRAPRGDARVLRRGRSLGTALGADRDATRSTQVCSKLFANQNCRTDQETSGKGTEISTTDPRLWPYSSLVGERGFTQILHCNFLRYHFQPFGLNLVLPSVVKPSGAIAKRGTRHLT